MLAIKTDLTAVKIIQAKLTAINRITNFLETL